MAFLPIQIAQVPGFGFQGGPNFSTDIKALASGREKRNGDWLTARHKYSAPFQNITNEAYLAIKEVFLITRGRLHTFLFRDWADFQASNEQFAVADGTTVVYQLKKVSQIGAGSYTRIITKPDTDFGVTIRVDGVVTGAAVSSSDGTVTFASPPAADAVLTWTGQFFVPVRFDNDGLPFSLDNRSNSDYIQNGSIDLIEIFPGDE